MTIPSLPTRSVTAAVVLLSAALLVGATNLCAQEDPAPAVPAQSDPPAGVEERNMHEMVLIHGIGGSARIWDDITPYLKGAFKVRTFELAGHGSTQPIVNPSIDKEVARLGALLDEIDFTYPVLVGHGLGGMIALQYSLENPGRVRRLILMDAAPVQLATDEEKADVAKQLLTDYDQFVADRFFNMSLSREVTDDIVDMALRTDAATFISLLMSSFDFDVTGDLRSLTVPMMVVGSQLMFPTPDGNEHLLEHYGFGSARSLSFKRIDHSGHYMMLERTVYTASVLLAFGAVGDHYLER